MGKEKEYEEEGHKIRNFVEKGDIEALHQILPTAADLVKATEYCHDRNHDIMEQITLSGNHEMLRRILKTYFSERSEENDDLRRRFLLSCQKGGNPKNFHYFSLTLPPLEAMEKMALSKTYDEQTINTREFNRINEDFRKPTNNIYDQHAQEKMKVYETIRDAYMEAYPKTNPHKRMKNERYGLAPKGEASIEAVGYTFDGLNKVSVIKEFDITYPMIRLVNISKEQSENETGNEPLKCPCFDIKATIFTEGKNDLAEQVWNKMDFPDAWIDGNYFVSLHKFGEIYQKIHDDPIADAVVHNFNQNNKFYTFENNPDTYTGDASYIGYCNWAQNYICLRTFPYNSPLIEHLGNVILHEGAHDTDNHEFSQTDLYKFIATAIYIHPKKSEGRELVNLASAGYHCSEYESETLARIPEYYFECNKYNDDPFLKATCNIFSAYGKAKLENKPAILNRISRCMRLRTSGKIGYENLSNITDMRLAHFAEKDRAEKKDPPDPYIGSFAPVFSPEELKQQEQALKQQYDALNGNENSVENEIIKCINAELKAIEKINQHPLAGKVELDLDTISRDNITEETPLEVLIAKTFECSKKISHLRAQKYSENELIEETKKMLLYAQQEWAELQKDKDESMFFDRSLFLTAMRHTISANTYIQPLMEKYWPKIAEKEKNKQENINNYQTDFLLKNISTLVDNIQLIKHPSPEMQIHAEQVYPTHDANEDFLEGEEKYHEYKALPDNDQRIQYIRNIDYTDSSLENRRFMQLLYKDFNPQAKTLPEDLHLSFKNFTHSCIKYSEIFAKKLEAKKIELTPQLNIETSSHSL